MLASEYIYLLLAESIAWQSQNIDLKHAGTTGSVPKKRVIMKEETTHLRRTPYLYNTLKTVCNFDK